MVALLDDAVLWSLADLGITAGMGDESGHVPVLGREVVQLLLPPPLPTTPRIVLDCTVGRGGHAAMLIALLPPGSTYIGLDADPANISYTRDRLVEPAKRHEVTLHLVHANFNAARGVLNDLSINGVDALLADLGFASNQLSDAARGFSFAAEGPLDMRLDPRISRTAADLVNTLGEQELADMIYRYGEERLSRKIARKIVETRQRDPILTTSALAELVRRAYGRHGAAGRDRKRRKGKGGTRHSFRRIDPATRTFMALRIAVNDELTALEQLLDNMEYLLASGGRAAIISFHSLEDRIVKQRFLHWQQTSRATRLTRKPVTAGESEQQDNPRSRSAKLRAIEWTE